MKMLTIFFSLVVMLAVCDVMHLTAGWNVLIDKTLRDVDAVSSNEERVLLVDRHSYRHCHYRARRVFCHT